MKNKKILLFIAIILVIGAGIAFIFFKGNKGFKTPAYIECVPTADYEGPMTFYEKYDSLGGYAYYLIPDYEKTGTYKVKDGYISYSDSDIKVKIKNGIPKHKDYKCKRISKEEFNKEIRSIIE